MERRPSRRGRLRLRKFPGNGFVEQKTNEEDSTAMIYMIGNAHIDPICRSICLRVQHAYNIGKHRILVQNFIYILRAHKIRF